MTPMILTSSVVTVLKEAPFFDSKLARLNIRIHYTIIFVCMIAPFIELTVNAIDAEKNKKD